MSKLREYLAVGFCNSYGDADYSVSCAAADLTPAQVQELRAMIPVAVATLEKYLQEAIAKTLPQAQQPAMELSERAPIDTNVTKA